MTQVARRTRWPTPPNRGANSREAVTNPVSDKQLPNNSGRVGQWGVSHPGWYTVMGMVEPHPALQAASPQATTCDAFIGDDDHRNGAFFLTGVDW